MNTLNLLAESVRALRNLKTEIECVHKFKEQKCLNCGLSEEYINRNGENFKGWFNQRLELAKGYINEVKTY